MIVEQQIVKKYNEELLFGQQYIIQSQQKIFLKNDMKMNNGSFVSS